jgi:hypothetical protein
MDTLIARIQRIQKDFQALSNELDEVLHEHVSPISVEQPQIILPARKRGRPNKADAKAREAVNQIQKAEDAAKDLVAVRKPTKKLKSPKPDAVEPEELESSTVKICRTCGIDLSLATDHRHCFFSSGFQSSVEWTQDCIAYAKEIGAGVAYSTTS